MNLNQSDVDRLDSQAYGRFLDATTACDLMLERLGSVRPERMTIVRSLFAQLSQQSLDQAAMFGAEAELLDDDDPHRDHLLDQEADVRDLYKVWVAASVMVTELMESHRLTMKAQTLRESGSVDPGAS